MKILFVVGGSYKSFYLNHLKSFSKIDLLIFQEGLIYDYDYYNEMFGNKLVSNEMIDLQKKLKCKIIAPIKTNIFNVVKKELLICDKNGIKLLDYNKKIKLYYKNKRILFSTNFKDKFNGNLNIMLLKKDANLFLDKINSSKTFLICDNYGVILKKRKKMTRKFRKICYFSLKF